MTQFALTLNFPDDKSYRDLRAALRYISRYTAQYRGRTEHLEIGDDAAVKNEDGETIGHWEIDESGPAKS